MRVWSTIFAKEAIELAPAAVVAALLGFAIGCVNSDHPFLMPTSVQTLVLSALCVGLWQGVLDRRLRASGFARHRPVDDRTWATARTAAGWVAATAPLLMFFWGRWIFRAWYPPEERESIAYVSGLTEAMIAHAYWRVSVWTYVNGLVAWAIVRATVSIHNRVAAAVLTLCFPLAVLFHGVFWPNPGDAWAVVALACAVVFSGSAFGRVASGGVR